MTEWEEAKRREEGTKRWVAPECALNVRAAARGIMICVSGGRCESNELVRDKWDLLTDPGQTSGETAACNQVTSVSLVIPLPDPVIIEGLAEIEEDTALRGSGRSLTLRDDENARALPALLPYTMSISPSSKMCT